MYAIFLFWVENGWNGVKLSICADIVDKKRKRKKKWNCTLLRIQQKTQWDSIILCILFAFYSFENVLYSIFTSIIIIITFSLFGRLSFWLLLSWYVMTVPFHIDAVADDDAEAKAKKGEKFNDSNRSNETNNLDNIISALQILSYSLFFCCWTILSFPKEFFIRSCRKRIEIEKRLLALHEHRNPGHNEIQINKKFGENSSSYFIFFFVL